MQGYGMGRYVPPELEGTVSFNQASGKGHPLGVRARKLKSEGILVVRFECPFAIWCTNCNPEQIIGQGVRFNAEKKKVGNYLSTPIWSFRIKHTVCGKWIEVRTDPKNTEYVVTEGGRRRDTGVDKLVDGEIRLGVSEEDKERLEKDGAFGSLEKKVIDKKILETQKTRLEDLVRLSQQNWSDPYEMSRKLRKDFRPGRRKRQTDERSGEALQDKYGLGVDLLADTEEDLARVKHVDFGEQKVEIPSAKPLFKSDDTVVSTVPNKAPDLHQVRRKDLASDPRNDLHSKLSTNTRRNNDPFLTQSRIWKPPAKRKRADDAAGQTNEPTTTAESVVLVTYDSDSQ